MGYKTGVSTTPGLGLNMLSREVWSVQERGVWWGTLMTELIGFGATQKRRVLQEEQSAPGRAERGRVPVCVRACVRMRVCVRACRACVCARSCVDCW